MKRILGWLSLATLGLLVLLSAVAGWFALTETGLRLTLGWVGRAVPALELEDPRGSWLGGVELKRVAWGGEATTEALQFSASGLQFDWKLWSLIQGKLALTDVKAESIDLRLGASDDKAPATGPVRLPRVVLPLIVQIDNLDIGRFSLGQQQRVWLNTAFAASRLRWQGSTIKWYEADIDMTLPGSEGNPVFGFVAATDGELSLRGDYPLKAHVSLPTLRYPNEESLRQTLSASGLQFDQLLPAQVQAEVSGSVATLRVNARITAPLDATLTGQVALLTPDLPFELALTQHKANSLALGLPEPLDVSAIQLHASGDLTQQAVLLSGTVGNFRLGEQVLAPAAINADATLVWPNLTVRQLSLEQPQVVLNTRGCEWLLQPVQGQCEGRITNMQWPMADVEPQLRAESDWRLALDLSDNAEAMVDVALANLRGQLGDIAGSVARGAKPTSVSGEAAVQLQKNGQLYISSLELVAGKNRVQAQGGVSTSAVPVTKPLVMDMQLPQLDQLVAGVAGSVTGNVALSGSLVTPTVQGQLNINELSWRGGKVKQASLVLPASTLASVKTSLVASGVAVGDLTAASLNVNLSGNMQQHQLQVAATQINQADAPVTMSVVELTCAGAWQSETPQWEGRCNTLSGQLDGPKRNMPFALRQPIALVWQQANNLVTMQPWCLSFADAGICSVGQSELGPQAQVLHLTADNIPVGWLAPPVQQLVYSGTLSADVALSSLNPVVASATLQAHEAAARWQLPETVTPPADIVFDALKVQARIDEKALAATIVGQAPGVLALQGQLTVTDPMQARELNGHIEADVPELSQFAGFIEPIAGMQGRGSLRADLAGSLYKPSLTGQLNVAGDLLQLEYFDQPVNHYEITASFAGTRLEYQGQFSVADGQGQVTGEGYWDTLDNWQLNNQVGVENLTVKLPVGGSAKLNADVSLAAAPARVEVKGMGKILEANIQVDTLPPSRITVSPDTHIVGQEETDATLEQVVDVSLDLGDNFHFVGFGADLWLTGTLNYQQGAEEAAKAKGKVVVSKGRYRAYGQRLNVRKGELIFNGPLDNPIVQMEVVRDTSTIQVAGIRLSGTLQRPNTELFSEPSLSETDTAYFLVTGQRRSESSNADAASADAVLASAALGVGKFGAGKLAEELGIDDFQISAGQSESGTEAQVSGYVNSRLFVRYSTGLDHKANTLTLQYQLTPKLVLESVTGFNRALDLLYTFSID